MTWKQILHCWGSWCHSNWVFWAWFFNLQCQNAYGANLSDLKQPFRSPVVFVCSLWSQIGSGRQHALPSAVMPSVHHMFWCTALVSSFQVFKKTAWCEDVSLSFNMTALQICPFAVLNVILFRCLFNANRQTNNRTPFLGVLLIWQIGLGKIPKASPRENGDNYSLAFNSRLDIVDRWSMT